MYENKTKFLTKPELYIILDILEIQHPLNVSFISYFDVLL